MTELPAQEIPAEPAYPWWKLRATWLYAAILAGELSDHRDDDDVRYPVHRESIGTLSLPGGQVVAADPYIMSDQPAPFVQELAAEAAEVVAVRAVVGEGHERVAALVLHVGSRPIIDWQMATLPEQDVSELDDGSLFGYPVDAGTGSFGSPGAMTRVAGVLHADAGMLDDPISQALFDDGNGTRSAVVVAPEDGAAPVAVCSSGWGDGQYPTWLGIADTGDVMVAVTDFLLTSDPHLPPPSEAPTPASPPAAPRKTFLARLLGR